MVVYREKCKIISLVTANAIYIIYEPNSMNICLRSIVECRPYYNDYMNSYHTDFTILFQSSEAHYVLDARTVALNLADICIHGITCLLRN